METAAQSGQALGGVVFDLVRHVADARVKEADAAAALAAVLAGAPEGRRAALEERVLDSLWIQGMECATQTEEGPGKERRLATLLSKAIANGVVSTPTAMERLDFGMLRAAGVVRDAGTMQKKVIRANTRKHFVQHKYNLLREESEGYAKLFTLLSQRITDANYEHVERSLKSLVGHFKLDPNRVFDIVLQTFEQSPTNRHFLRLLGLFRSASLCHVLGVQFRMCAGDEQLLAAGADPQRTPASLYRLAAILLDCGKVQLEELLPHLAPAVADTQTAYQRHVESVRRIAGKASAEEHAARGGIAVTGALAAVALPIDDAPTPVPTAPLAATGTTAPAAADPAAAVAAAVTAPAAVVWNSELPPKPERENQWMGLLAALLHVRAWGHAERLMELLQKTGVAAADADVSVAAALRGHLHIALAPVYEPTSPASLRPPLCGDAQPFEFTPMDDRTDDDATTDLAVSSIVTSKLPAWSSAAPEQVAEGLVQLLRWIGVTIADDKRLLCKTCRVARLLLRSPDGADSSPSLPRLDPASPARAQLLQCVGTVLLPALSLCECSPGIALEVWSVVSELHYEERYMLYALWNEASHPRVELARRRAQYHARQLMKRLAAENVRIMGRQIAKVAHANPLVTVRTILDQIESYDNLIVPVVESLKFLTPLAFDVMTYVIIGHLASPRSMLKEDGTSFSHWLASLAKFTGQLYQKFPGIELSGLLQFVMNRLKENESLELLVLSELLTRMGGVENAEDMSDRHLSGLAGGPTLRHESSSFAQSSGKKSRKAVARLRDALLLPAVHGASEEERVAVAATVGHADVPQAVPLLVLIAQQQYPILYHSTYAYIKMIGRMFDVCQLTMQQYAEFLHATLSVSRLAEMLPSLPRLIRDFSLPAEAAFMAARPVLMAGLLEDQAASGGPGALSGSAAPGGMEVDGGGEAGAGGHAVPGEAGEAGEAESAGKASNGSGARDALRDWRLSSPQYRESVLQVLPAEAAKVLSLDFYSMFWTLSLYDIHMPADSYEEEAARLKRQAGQLDLHNGTPAELKQRKKERERLLLVARQLKDEREQQEQHVQRVLAMLRADAERWFSPASAQDVVPQFLQHCLLPRVRLSESDAMFCARFVLLLHDMSTPHFSTLTLVDKCVRELLPLLHCCSEREAGNLGIFLHRLFAVLRGWRSNEASFAKLCAAKRGFLRDYTKLSGPAIDYDAFIKAIIKWHDRLVRVFRVFLASTEYMHIRNGLIVLLKVVDEYPNTKRLCGLLEPNVAHLMTEQREDLKLMATRYHAMLVKRQKTIPQEEDDKYNPRAVGLAPPRKHPAAAAISPDTSGSMAPARTAAAERRGTSRNPAGSAEAAESPPADRDGEHARARELSEPAPSAQRAKPRTSGGAGAASAAGGEEEQPRDDDRKRERERDRGRGRSSRDRSKGRSDERGRERSRDRSRSASSRVAAPAPAESHGKPSNGARERDRDRSSRAERRSPSSVAGAKRPREEADGADRGAAAPAAAEGDAKRARRASQDERPPLPARQDSAPTDVSAGTDDRVPRRNGRDAAAPEAEDGGRRRGSRARDDSQPAAAGDGAKPRSRHRNRR